MGPSAGGGLTSLGPERATTWFLIAALPGPGYAARNRVAGLGSVTHCSAAQCVTVERVGRGIEPLRRANHRYAMFSYRA